jgi:arylsulfatase A-like enzyme
LKITVVLMLLGLLSSCSHPLEIVGEGDIFSSMGNNNCALEDQPCASAVAADYNITYTAEPHDGWDFVGWKGCADQHPDCTLNTLAAWVNQFRFATAPSLRAVFEPTPEPYNILLIIADDLSFNHYGFAGHPQLQTPSIDALAATSVQYPNAYVSGTCRPTLATLLTGLPEHRHGVTYIGGPQLGDYPTIADRLGKIGYATYQAGKFWEGLPSQRGFTDFDPFDSYTGNLSIGRASMDPLFNFINESSTPWFVWFSPYMPHSPHTAPSEYTAVYQELALSAATIEYFAMITWFDSVVGELLQEVAEDTIIIYLSDNGYVQSGFPGVSQRNSKGSSYELGIRTQLLIRHPEHEAVLHTEVASAVDVTATILSIAGATYLDLVGRDLLAPAPVESAAFGSGWSLGISVKGSKLLHRWIRDGDWKLVDVKDGMDRLHNLKSDPDETQNLVDASEWLSLQTELRKDLEAWWLE